MTDAYMQKRRENKDFSKVHDVNKPFVCELLSALKRKTGKAVGNVFV